MALIFLFLFLSCISAQSLDPNHNLKFVFEIVRHGARAPTRTDTLRFGSTFGPGELTPNGMRQRYFLGRYNYQRYHQDLGDYSKDIYVQSTNVHRTLQSGYSELLGMQT
jgi:lysosomal acid phosphatase